MLAASFWIAVGSSPHARGLRWIKFRCQDTGRIIPARAGFTLGLEG